MGYTSLTGETPEPAPLILCMNCAQAIASAAIAKFAEMHPAYAEMQVHCGMKIQERTIKVFTNDPSGPKEEFKWDELIKDLC